MIEPKRIPASFILRRTSIKKALRSVVLRSHDTSLQRDWERKHSTQKAVVRHNASSAKNSHSCHKVLVFTRTDAWSPAPHSPTLRSRVIALELRTSIFHIWTKFYQEGSYQCGSALARHIHSRNLDELTIKHASVQEAQSYTLFCPSWMEVGTSSRELCTHSTAPLLIH